jgi:NADH:ubiquinone reductase (H+-translocating)
VPLSGLPAKAVTRGYHLGAIPANRVRIACDWLLDAVLARQAVQFGLVRAAAVPLGINSPPPPASTSGYRPASPGLQAAKPIMQRH